MSMSFTPAGGAPPTAAAAPTVPVPGVRDVRANIGDAVRNKSTLKGVLFCVVSVVPYALGVAGFLVLEGWWLKGLSAALFTVALPMMFIVGHDACHHSLTPHRWLNKLIGRLTMIPTWHAYSVWDRVHNGLHHVWTNVRYQDYAWAPLSKAEYDRLTPIGRSLHRRYRTWWGVGPYYIIEMWLKYGMTGAKAQSPRMNVLFWIDRLSVVGFTIAMVAAVLSLTNRTGLGSNATLVSAGLLSLGVVIPFVAWNWAMGMIILLHHTHPTVPWYGDVADWSYYAGQVRSVVHIELPRPIELVLHHIMEHTAHHADPRVPLYNLEQAQKNLEAAYGESIVTVPFTLGGLFATLRTCRLFDYEQHRWLDWDGVPTTPPLLERNEGCVIESAPNAQATPSATAA